MTSKTNKSDTVATPKAPNVDADDTFSVAPDTVIFREGEDSDYAYLVIEGQVELTKSVEGAEIFLAEIGQGDLFGEMGLIDGSQRSATATTLGECILHKIDHDELLNKLNQDSDFAAPVLLQLVGQLRKTSDRLAHEQVLSLQRAADSADVIEIEPEGLLDRVRSFFDAEKDMIEFQPDAVEIERRKAPAIATVSLYTIFFFIAALFLWASVSTIDTAVSAYGRITTKVPNILVQPSQTSMIQSINVRPGQFVEKGTLLATLDATVAQADMVLSQSSLVSMLAQEARLRAESLGGQVPSAGFSDDPAENASQVEIFARRQDGLRERLASFDEQILELEGEIASNLQDVKDMDQQAAVVLEVEGMRKTLMDEGHGSRLNYLSAKHQRLSIDREQRRLNSSRTRMMHQLEALRADKEGALASWQSSVAEELVTTRRERERLAEQLTRSEHRESNVRLIAPAPGIVLSVAERSVGSLIREAEVMFTIVPANVDMEMEVDVLPKDVGLIQVGDIVRIKLEALPFQKHGIIEGEVRFISEDAVAADDRGSQSVYRTRIKLGEHKLRDVPSTFRLTPGHTGSADITVGKRRIITYFIYPIMRAFDSSFREP